MWKRSSQQQQQQSYYSCSFYLSIEFQLSRNFCEMAIYKIQYRIDDSSHNPLRWNWKSSDDRNCLSARRNKAPCWVEYLSREITSYEMGLYDWIGETKLVDDLFSAFRCPFALLQPIFFLSLSSTGAKVIAFGRRGRKFSSSSSSSFRGSMRNERTCPPFL